MDTTEIAKSFIEAIMRRFDDFLRVGNFEKIHQRAEEYGFSVIYRSGERYIRFSGTLHPVDFPLYFSLALGEGSADFPESDWNAIPIFLFPKQQDHEEFGKCKDLFSINMDIALDEIEKKIGKTFELLLKYGQPFINNDLASFRKLRAEQSNARKPYRMLIPQKDGKRRIEYEKQSSELKEKYSKQTK